MRAAVYARVSTFDQEPENQLAELRRYAEARGWTATEFVDRIDGLESLIVALRAGRCRAVDLRPAAAG